MVVDRRHFLLGIGASVGAFVGWRKGIVSPGIYDFGRPMYPYGVEGDLWYDAKEHRIWIVRSDLTWGIYHEPV